MVINALNSGAQVYMADFEDSALADVARDDRRANQSARCVRGAIAYTSPEGKQYALHPTIADADGPAAGLAPRSSGT